jgi:putative ABC transport system permease protein
MVAVVNASTAGRLFPGGRAVGRRIDIGGRPFTIVGVVADAMHLNAFSDIWTPLTTAPSSDYRQQLFGSFTALLLAKSPADLPAIRREVVQASSRVEFDDPAKWKRALFRADSKLDAFARLTIGGDNPAEGEMTVDEGSSGAAIMLSAIAVLMLLFMLLPALNMVNLNVGRIMERSAEIGVRKAFGATSATLIGQLVVENVLLCLAGGVLALGCAQGVLWWLQRSALIPYLDVDVNLAVFGWSLLIATVFGLLSGVLPAWRMARLDPVSALKGNA